MKKKKQSPDLKNESEAIEPVVEARRPKGRPSDYDPIYCKDVIEDMGQGYTLGAFAGKIGVCRKTINDWMAAHPDFLQAVSRGKVERLRFWEGIAVSIARGQGGPGASTMTIFGLKNMGADDWTETQRLELTGKDGKPIETTSTYVDAAHGIDMSKLSFDELARLKAAEDTREELRAKAAHSA